MKPILTLFLLCLLGHPGTARALESDWQAADFLRARLIGAQDAAQPDSAYRAAIEIQLEEGWHAYWRTPGDGGLPPHFDWRDSENIVGADMRWPAPTRFEIEGYNSFGYEGTVILPVDLTPGDPRNPMKVNVEANIMACREICVPQELSLSLEVPEDGFAEDTAQKQRIEKAEAAVPLQGDQPRLKIENVVIGPEAVVVNAYAASGYENADLFIEADELFITASPEINIDDKDARKAMLRVPAPADMGNLAEALAGKEVTLTLKSGTDAIEKKITF